MSRIVVREESVVKLLSITRDECPICQKSKDHVRVVEERPVFGEDDYKLPKLVVLETERSPRGSIDWSASVGNWVCTDGTNPRWSSYEGWNDVRGKLYVIYPADAKVAIVGNRLERGEGFYNPKFVQAEQGRGWTLMANMDPIHVEPYVREQYHPGCVAEALMTAIEPPIERFGTQGHLDIFQLSDSWDMDYRDEGPIRDLTVNVGRDQVNIVWGDSDLVFLNHRISVIAPGSPQPEAKPEVKEDRYSRRTTLADLMDGVSIRTTPYELTETTPEVPSVLTFQRSGKIYSFVRVQASGCWISSPDHPGEDIQLSEGYYLFVHPVPSRDGDDD